MNSKILVAGAGGLGSTLLSNLASIGIGNIGIVDNDIIELSNLNRQYIHKYENIGKIKVESAKEWINSFNPDIKVDIFRLRLDETNYRDIINDYDLIIDYFDSYKSKFLLNKIAVKNNKILVQRKIRMLFFYAVILTCVTPVNKYRGHNLNTICRS